jgi:hypothetical protein
VLLAEWRRRIAIAIAIAKRARLPLMPGLALRVRTLKAVSMPKVVLATTSPLAAI